MASNEFETKTWVDRIAEYPNRRTLTKEDGSTELVTVTRDEGTVSQEGDAFNAKNMNDLETRIKAITDYLYTFVTDCIDGIRKTINEGDFTAKNATYAAYLKGGTTNYTGAEIDILTENVAKKQNAVVNSLKTAITESTSIDAGGTATVQVACKAEGIAVLNGFKTDQAGIYIKNLVQSGNTFKVTMRNERTSAVAVSATIYYYDLVF